MVRRSHQPPPKQQGRLSTVAGTWNWRVVEGVGSIPSARPSFRELYWSLKVGIDLWLARVDLPDDGPRIDDAKAGHLFRHAAHWTITLTDRSEARIVLGHDHPIPPEDMLAREAQVPERVSFSVTHYGSAIVANASRTVLAAFTADQIRAWAKDLMTANPAQQGHWPVRSEGESTWTFPASWTFDGGRGRSS